MSKYPAVDILRACNASRLDVIASPKRRRLSGRPRQDLSDAVNEAFAPFGHISEDEHARRRIRDRGATSSSAVVPQMGDGLCGRLRPRKGVTRAPWGGR